MYHLVACFTVLQAEGCFELSYDVNVCFQITETYAFLPREAVTRFLLGCTECQRRPRSPSPASLLPTPSPSPTLPPAAAPRAPPSDPTTPSTALEYYRGTGAVVASAPPDKDFPIQGSKVDSAFQLQLSLQPGLPPPQTSATAAVSLSNQHISQSHTKIDGPLRTSTPEPKRSSNPLDVCNLTSRDPPKISTPPKKRHLNHLSENKEVKNPAPKIWSPVEGNTSSVTPSVDQSRVRSGLLDGEIDYSLPITTTYLKYMRSLGCTDEDALKFEKVSN